MNALTHTFDKFDAFGQQKTHLILLLNDRRFKRRTIEEQGRLIECVRLASTCDRGYDKKLILDALESVVYQGQMPIIIRQESGSNFGIEVDLDPEVVARGGFTGWRFVARDEETMAALSNPEKAGTAEARQRVDIYDYPYHNHQIRGLLLLLEESEGEASTLVQRLFVQVVPKAIDSI